MRRILFIFTMAVIGTTSLDPGIVVAQTDGGAEPDEQVDVAAEPVEDDASNEEASSPGEGEDEVGDEDETTDEGDSAEDAGATESEEEPDPELEDDPFDDFDSIGPGAPGAADDFRRSERPLELMSRSELADAGFEFGEQSDGSDTSTALLLSLTAGTFVHGIGHLYLGDSRTGFFLLGMQGVSLGLMASSVGFLAVTDGASPAAAFFAPALQSGLALFVYSWVIDVVGSLQGTDHQLAANTSENRGFGFRARYGFFDATGLPIRHAIDARVSADFGGFYTHVAALQDVFLEGGAYRANLGVRPLRGREPLSYLSVETNGEYLQWQGLGEFGVFSIDGRIGGSYQLGGAYPHVSEFALGGEIGFGNRWYQIAPRDTQTFEFARSELWVPFDLFASLNISKRLNVTGGYGSAELSLVPPSTRMLGVTHLEFLYRGTSYGDISLRAEVGDGIALFLGGSLWFGR